MNFEQKSVERAFRALTLFIPMAVDQPNSFNFTYPLQEMAILLLKSIRSLDFAAERDIVLNTIGPQILEKMKPFIALLVNKSSSGGPKFVKIEVLMGQQRYTFNSMSNLYGWMPNDDYLACKVRCLFMFLIISVFCLDRRSHTAGNLLSKPGRFN